MRTIGNLIWVIVAGWWLALSYVLAGVVMFLFIVTIPFGIQSFKLAGYVLWPFGRAIVPIPKSAAAKTPTVVANVLWVVFSGFWLALGHVMAGVILCIFIITIPFGIASFKMAWLALVPFGKTVVPARLAAQYGDAFVIGGD